MKKKKRMKKINYNEKRKKNGAGTEMGYCPNCIAIQFIVLQEGGLFGWKKFIARLVLCCNRGRLAGDKLYRNTLPCIVIGRA